MRNRYKVHYSMIKENCSGGCPCSDFDCLPPTSVPTTQTTTTPISPTGKAVLVLTTYNLNNRPFIVDFNGKYLIFFSNIDSILIQETLTKIWILNTAMVQTLSTVVGQP